MAERNMVEAINQALAVELARDERVLLFGEDVGRVGGVFRATQGLQGRFGADRVFDTPISESAIVGVACGMAAAGLRPVPEIQFMGFVMPAFNQLVSQAARLHGRSGGRYPMSMVVRVPYGGLIGSPELHADSLEAPFVHAPGLKVVCPSTPTEAKGLLHAAMADPDPVLFLEPIRLYRQFREAVPDDYFTLPLGQARIARPGRDVTIIAWGTMVHTALTAADSLAAQDISAEVIDLRSLWPLDTQTIAASVERTGRAVVVHEAPRTAGVGAEIVAAINDTALWSLLAPVQRVCGWDVPYPTSALEEFYVPDAGRIVGAVLEAMA